MCVCVCVQALSGSGGLESECCGEERTRGGTPLAGLVPGPPDPANYTQEEKRGEERRSREEKRGEERRSREERRREEE